MTESAGRDQVRTLHSLTEKRFEREIEDLAHALGWTSYHPYLSIRSAPGWPDLVLCRPPRLLLCEVKTEAGRLSPAQRAWLSLLAGCPGVEVYLLRPCHLQDLAAALQGDPAASERLRAALLREIAGPSC